MSKNKAKRTTLQDIADVVGMTKMTVSRYMKNPNLVKISSRIEIESAISKLGYIPNRAPNILSKGKSHAIGVLFPSISNHVFDEVLRGIESVTEPAGYQIMIAHSSGVPVTEIMDTCTPPIQQAVGFNNMQASQKMTEKLIQKGYKNIAYIGAKGDVRDILRQRGYEAAITEHGLKSLVFRSPDVSSIRLGSEILDSILGVHPKVDAAICTNDDVAMGVLLSCKKKGILVPDELAVSGMHGHEMGQLYSPKLASVITPRFNIGKVAAEQLLSRIDGVQVIDECIDLGFEINDGESI